MRKRLAYFLHRIEQRCVRLRKRLGVNACVGCACGWPTEAEQGSLPGTFWHMHETPYGYGMDCTEDTY